MIDVYEESRSRSHIWSTRSRPMMQVCDAAEPFPSSGVMCRMSPSDLLSGCVVHGLTSSAFMLVLVAKSC